MSPILARSAAQAGLRLASRRQFSLMTSLRQLGRSFEHGTPFERLPVTQKPQGADWGRQFKRVGGQAVVFLPAMAVMLGWPYAAAVVVEVLVG
ncbi:hypothetical protein CONLIGDRAFT_686509 [Coniochaeta ligniaria NRRL 30616]|uniref:Uncharacterized protein n=1 Tax=Coniochaeta ligniaria NRRL 30616 TaxID=1408157 RepID=A0A1J7I833_9PEZI|nr:hypothetical protein CONLIGDRAFT_686509 [Coniochaeta ligniaria NRRL 30616]